ncbi:MAG TPA: AzlD domain-containing protein [Solirubrobacteraceae bacterium]|nr:AzlD domain-containing protein [Solirubrobacteraceae bacterium]
MTSNEIWLVIALCAVATAVIKGAGPIALGGRELPSWFSGVIQLMAPALLAALVAVAAFSDHEEWAIGADTAGVAAGGLVLWRGANVVVGGVVAAGVTALLRAL